MQYIFQKIVKFLFYTALMVCAIFGSSAVMAQSGRHSVGVNVAYGWELFPQSYHYRTTMIEGQYRYSACHWSWGALEVVAQLHINPTHYATDYPMVDFERSVEVGVTAGLNLKINIVKDYFTVNILGFIGPLYTPHLPARQGGWLNFSDNLAVALNVKLYQNLHLDIRGGFRHLSNAGLFTPNYGINTPFIGFGLFYKI